MYAGILIKNVLPLVVSLCNVNGTKTNIRYEEKNAYHNTEFLILSCL